MNSRSELRVNAPSRFELPLWLVDGERGLWRYAVAVVLVLAGAAFAQWLLVTAQLIRISIILLMGVVMTATWLGARPALFAAVFSFVVYRLMLAQPDMQARVDSTDQIITLTLFMTAALLTGSLAGRMRDAGRRSALLAARNKALFLASRAMSEAEDETEIRAVLRAHVDALVGAPASWDTPADASAWHVGSLQADRDHIEPLYWRTTGHLNADEESDLASAVDLMCDLASAAVARSRAAANRAKLESIAQTEQLQAALLSSISHDFRTPLSAILTSASSLRTFDTQFDAGTRRDLCRTIEEETERLNRFVAKLLRITRLEAGVLRAEIAPFDARATADAIAWRAGGPEGRVRIEMPAALRACGDPLLFEHALSNVVENALRFCPHAPIVVRGAREGDAVAFTVSDRGRGVPPAELDAIFERFYCASNNDIRRQSSGLGLSIARGLMAAMSGSIVARAGEDGAGLDVQLTLPAAP